MLRKFRCLRSVKDHLRLISLGHAHLTKHSLDLIREVSLLFFLFSMMVDLNRCSGHALLSYSHLVSATERRQVFFFLTLFVLHLLSFSHQAFDIRLFIKVCVDQDLSETFIEYQTVVVMIETILVDAHESEEFGIHHLFCPQYGDFFRENLAEICFHLFGLFIE